MSNPSQYHGMPNGYPPVTNGPAMHQQYPPSQQQQQQQQYPVKPAMNGPSSQQYGLPPVAAVAPLQNGPPPMMGQKGVPPPAFNTQLPQQNNRVANLVSNGNSATSSRTSSPALVNNNIPASQLPPRPGVPYQTPSSQSQTTPVVSSSSNYQLSPNNNWTSGINTNLVNTPPRTASGLSTPLNASTPTINGPAVSNLTTSMQNLNVNRPHSAQQLHHLNGSGTPQPPPTSVPNSSSYQQNQLPPPPSMKQQPNVQQQVPNMPPTYGQQQQPQLNQQGRPINGNYAPQQQQQPQQPPQQPPTGQPYPGMPPISSTGPVASTPINKRPLYPSQPVAPVAPTQTNNYYQQQQQQQPMPNNNNLAQQQQQQQQLQQHHHHHSQHQNQHQQQQNYQQQQHQDPQYNVVKSGFNRLWGNNTIDLLQNRHILPTDKVRPPVIHHHGERSRVSFHRVHLGSLLY